MAGKVIDLTGLKVHKLTVLNVNEQDSTKRRGKDKKVYKYWNCICECGNIKSIRGDDLRKGKIKSCGCHRKEMAGKTLKSYNEEQWKKEEYRQVKVKQIGEVAKKTWQNEEYRQKMAKLSKERWQNEEYRKIMYDSVYKGGITPISLYLRSIDVVRQWKRNTYVRENSKCQLTGKQVHGGNSDVHHLKSFNTIVREAHELYKIAIKENVQNYTKEELNLLENYIAEWHKDTTNAVLLDEGIHKLFHHIYGYGDNTLNQFEEFKRRYLHGEFNNILN